MVHLYHIFLKLMYIFFDNDLNKSGLNGSYNGANILKTHYNIDSYIGNLPLYFPETKMDVNILYLINKQRFISTINYLIKSSILYSSLSSGSSSILYSSLSF